MHDGWTPTKHEDDDRPDKLGDRGGGVHGNLLHDLAPPRRRPLGVRAGVGTFLLPAPAMGAIGEVRR